MEPTDELRNGRSLRDEHDALCNEVQVVRDGTPAFDVQQRRRPIDSGREELAVPVTESVETLARLDVRPDVL